MRKVTLFYNISLDGFISGPNDNIDWVIADKELHESAIEFLSAADVILYGRKTYQIMADFWPTVKDDPSNPGYIVAFANTLNPMKKIAFSKTLKSVGWNTKIITEFDPKEIRKMKEQRGKNIAVGGANLAQQFMQHDLIDEFQLLVHPVVLGGGKPLFNYIKDRMNLKLMKTKIFASGVVSLHYNIV
jgi:dihydrofolate reductase